MQLFFIRIWLKLLEGVSPRLAANRIFQFMSKPRMYKRRAFEEAVLARARREELQFGEHVFNRYRWGNGRKNILLIHGWEGHAGNFGKIIEKLETEDWTITSFDAPAHGQSPRVPTNMFEFVNCVSYLIQQDAFDAIASHSFGSIANLFALSMNPKIAVQKVVLLTSPDRFDDRIEMIRSTINFSDKTKTELLALIQKETGFDPLELNASAVCPSINVEKALIVQDKFDKVLPIDWARNIHSNWPVSEMVELENVGHYRLLWNEEVVSIVHRFLDENQE